MEDGSAGVVVGRGRYQGRDRRSRHGRIYTSAARLADRLERAERVTNFNNPVQTPCAVHEKTTSRPRALLNSVRESFMGKSKVKPNSRTGLEASKLDVSDGFSCYRTLVLCESRAVSLGQCSEIICFDRLTWLPDLDICWTSNGWPTVTEESSILSRFVECESVRDYIVLFL